MARTKSSTRATPKSSATGTGARHKAASAYKKAEPVVVTETAPVVGAPDLKKVELIDAVVERSGVKKKYAKPAIEAALAVLGESLAEGRDLNLRPLGKVKIQRSKDVANAKVITARIRHQLQAEKSEEEGVADAAE